jgi:hypothetical protein
MCLLFISLLFGCGGGGGNTQNSNTTTANAGPDQSVIAGSVVTLDGSQSTGANNSLITYQWSMVFIPNGSSAFLSSATVVNPTFTADVAGSYVLNLVVNDGMVNSAPSTVTITASVANAAPVANAGIAQSVTTGAVVTLNGSDSSDANGDPLTYAWAFTSKPAGSSAVLSSATVVNPTFTADLAGPYVLNLVVNDGMVNSTPSTVTITASAPNYVGSYSGTYQYDNTALTGGTLDIVIAGYSTTTLTGTIDTHKGDGPIAFSSGSITGDIFQASIEGIFNDTTIDGTFTPDGLTLSGTFQNSNPSEENGTFTVTKQ